MAYHRSFLKWAGGKAQLMPIIQAHLPEGDMLIEPFLGGGAVFLNTHYDHYILNDINPDLIETYRQLKKNPKAFIEDCKRLFKSNHNNKEKYLSFRSKFNTLTDPYQRARFFIYFNRHGYNGLCRYNSTGGFNVPFGAYKKPYFPEDELYYCAQKLKKARLLCQNYHSVFKYAKDNHVIYCDPPYAARYNTLAFTSYSKEKFDWNAQQQLAQLCEQTAHSGTPVVISNHDCPEIRRLYHTAKIIRCQARRSISCTSKARKPANEVIAVFQ